MGETKKYSLFGIIKLLDNTVVSCKIVSSKQCNVLKELILIKERGPFPMFLIEEYNRSVTTFSELVK